VKFLRDQSRFRIVNKARQIGYSFTIGLEAVIGAGIGNRDQLLVSSSEKNAAEVLDKCRKWARVLQLPLEKDSYDKIEFVNGKKILSLAQNPDTVRGYSGDVYLDEFAHHKFSEEIFRATFPIATLGFRFTIISTPLAKSGRFYSLYNDTGVYSNYSRHRTTIIEAVQQGLRVDIDSIRNAIDEETFRQEYLCEFVDESTAYFPYELLLSNTGDSADSMLDGATNYIGIDIGRRNDRTAIVVLSQLNEGLTVSKVEVLDRMEFAKQREVIRQVVQGYGIQGGGIDASGLGMQMAEELNQEFAWLEPVSFTNAIKETIAVTVKRKFEERRLTIPNDKNLISDIHSIKRSVTQSGNIRFDAERTSQGHSDRFWALALAVYSATNPVYAPEVRFI